MLLSRRSFERHEPFKDSKCIYIFGEGVREFNYFKFFKEFDSRIKIEVYPLQSEGENNSPSGLYNIACNSLLKPQDNPIPVYDDFRDWMDEIWIVLDTDIDRDSSRIPQIEQIRLACREENQRLSLTNEFSDVWNIVESNPCFEVWLYYHVENEKPDFDGIEISSTWKSFLDTALKGGFDLRKHPQLIGDAIKNAELNYQEIDFKPGVACTQVYRLAKSIYPLILEKLTAYPLILEKLTALKNKQCLKFRTPDLA